MIRDFADGAVKSVIAVKIQNVLTIPGNFCSHVDRVKIVLLFS